MTHVTLEGLSSKVNYTLRIYARNRVSEVAKRRYGVEGKFEAISVRMKESGEEQSLRSLHKIN